MRKLVMMAGARGLAAVHQRLGKPDLSDGSRLQLLACVAEQNPRSTKVVPELLRLLKSEKVNWRVAIEVMRVMHVTEHDTEQLRNAWRTHRDGNRSSCSREDDYRFLFAVGAVAEGMSLLEQALPSIEQCDATPPCDLGLFEDVPYYPAKYQMALEKLLNADLWKQRGAAAVMFMRYNRDTYRDHLDRMSTRDPHPFVRRVLRELQESQRTRTK